MPTADLYNGRISLVDTEYRDKDRCKQMPGAAYKNGQWTATISWAAVKILRSLWPDVLITQALSDWCWAEYNERVMHVVQLRADAMNPELDAPSHIEGLRPYQNTGALFLTLSRGATLADDMGTGKTAQAIAAVENTEQYPCLVVCPAVAKESWRREYLRWAPHRKVVVVTGNAPARRKLIESEAEVYIIGYPVLRTHTRIAGYGSLALTDAEKEPKELNVHTWKAIIADEAHRVVDPKAKQTRALWGVSAKAGLRLALTGTPMVNAPDDFWSLLHYVAPEEWPSKTKYLERYCIKEFDMWGHMSITGLEPANAAEFYTLADLRYLRRPKALVNPWLPEKIYERRDVEMLPKQKTAYDSMKKNQLAVLDSGTSMALDELTELTRLTQLASACADVNPAGEFRLCLPSSKIQALLELLEDMGSEQLVVFALSRQLIDLAAIVLEDKGIPCSVVVGGQTDYARQDAIDEFQAGRARVILLTLGAGSEAITLTAASTVCFLQRSWSMVQNRQAEDRVHRIGQEADKVTIVDLIAPGTVEEHIAQAIERKGDMLEEIVRDKESIRLLLGAQL